MTAGFVSVDTTVLPWALVVVMATATEAVGWLRMALDAIVVSPAEFVFVIGTGTMTADCWELAGGAWEVGASEEPGAWDDGA